MSEISFTQYLMPHGRKDNPWVAAYTFSVAMGNIDQVEK